MYDRPPLSPAPALRRGTGEPLTAWERWDMGAVTQERAAAPRAVPAAAPAKLAPLAPVLLIDEAELKRLRLLAQQTGEAEGRRLGYAQGQAEGHAAAMATVHEQAAQLRALTLALPAALLEAEREVADDLLALALDIARQVLGQALTADPQVILTVVRDLLQAEPPLTGAPQLVLHPDDAALVNEHLADDLKTAGWRIRADVNNERGGCRVMASSGERDATLASRWERVTATLARHAPVHAAVAHD